MFQFLMLSSLKKFQPTSVTIFLIYVVGVKHESLPTLLHTDVFSRAAVIVFETFDNYLANSCNSFQLIKIKSLH